MLLGILFNLLKKLNQIFEISVLESTTAATAYTLQSAPRQFSLRLPSAADTSGAGWQRPTFWRLTSRQFHFHFAAWRNGHFPRAIWARLNPLVPGAAPPYLLTDILRHRWKILGAELIFPPEDRPPQFWPSRRKSSRSWRRWRHEIETSDVNREPVLNE